MKIIFASLLTGALCTPLVVPESAAPQDPQEMRAMMERAKRYTQPGEHHKILERFIGTWDTETRITMGDQSSPAEKGVATTSWLMAGRWLQTKTEGRLMGMSTEGFTVMGYDNFKHSFVVTFVSSMDTAMVRAEGDMDPSGKALITYGTMDEYLTGEHDKMVKYLWRFVSDDEIVLEIHDLPIGEKNTMVVEIRSKRRS